MGKKKNKNKAGNPNKVNGIKKDAKKKLQSALKKGAQQQQPGRPGQGPKKKVRFGGGVQNAPARPEVRSQVLEDNHFRHCFLKPSAPPSTSATTAKKKHLKRHDSILVGGTPPPNGPQHNMAVDAVSDKSTTQAEGSSSPHKDMLSEILRVPNADTILSLARDKKLVAWTVAEQPPTPNVFGQFPGSTADTAPKYHLQTANPPVDLPASPVCACFGPDLLFLGMCDGSVTLLCMKSGQQFSFAAYPKEQSKRVQGVAYFKEILMSVDQSGCLKLWKFGAPGAAPSCVWEMEIRAKVSCFSLVDDKWIFLGTNDKGLVRLGPLENLQNCSPERVGVKSAADASSSGAGIAAANKGVTGASVGVTALAVLAGRPAAGAGPGSRVAAAMRDGSLRLLDAESGFVLARLDAHKMLRNATAMCASSCNTRVILGHSGGKLSSVSVGGHVGGLGGNAGIMNSGNDAVLTRCAVWQAVDSQCNISVLSWLVEKGSGGFYVAGDQLGNLQLWEWRGGGAMPQQGGAGAMQQPGLMGGMQQQAGAGAMQQPGLMGGMQHQGAMQQPSAIMGGVQQQGFGLQQMAAMSAMAANVPIPDDDDDDL